MLHNRERSERDKSCHRRKQSLRLRLAVRRDNLFATRRGSASAIRLHYPHRHRHLHLHRFHSQWSRRSNILIALRCLTFRRAKQVADF